MTNKLFLVLSVLIILILHIGFEPRGTLIRFDQVTQVVIKEYESACIDNNGSLNDVLYTCKDLKGYLLKRGYK